jgi:hypothetical protein
VVPVVAGLGDVGASSALATKFSSLPHIMTSGKVLGGRTWTTSLIRICSLCT